MVTTKEYTFENVTAGHTISAEFDNMVNVTLKVDSSAVGNCKIRYKIGSATTWTNITSPTTTGTIVSVPSGSTMTIECYDIAAGKSFEKVRLEDSFTHQYVDYTDNPHTTATIAIDISYTFFLTTITYTIVASAGTGGSISPSGNVSVEHGASQTFTITADSGYHISRILVDGSPIQL